MLQQFAEREHTTTAGGGFTTLGTTIAQAFAGETGFGRVAGHFFVLLDHPVDDLGVSIHVRRGHVFVRPDVRLEIFDKLVTDLAQLIVGKLAWIDGYAALTA